MNNNCLQLSKYTSKGQFTSSLKYVPVGRRWTQINDFCPQPKLILSKLLID